LPRRPAGESVCARIVDVAEMDLVLAHLHVPEMA
jgi:hypothetical protein